MAKQPRPERPQPLTFTEVADYYNEPGTAFDVSCPAHDNADFTLAVRQGAGNRLRVACDSGCSRHDIIEVLTARIRGDAVIPTQAQLRLLIPDAGP